MPLHPPFTKKTRAYFYKNSLSFLELHHIIVKDKIQLAFPKHCMYFVACFKLFEPNGNKLFGRKSFSQ